MEMRLEEYGIQSEANSLLFTWYIRGPTPKDVLIL
jgi:hypothetical protein